ncbi:hypothetical protein GO998_24560 (plasmid) [Ralstonia syzygii]|uniref:Uncharacterized protein n=1 Tax=Ralstonia syzygii TaxID=28097 RepID=A0ABX7ZPZ5_9RALS|nr:hypothetical protein [Ralstonia syzygii]QUP56804.1 hypothetical protein GO998_24560 [Ralstonia syzygii]
MKKKDMPKAIGGKTHLGTADKTTSTAKAEALPSRTEQTLGARSRSGILCGLNCFKPIRQKNANEAAARTSLPAGRGESPYFGSDAQVRVRQLSVTADSHTDEEVIASVNEKRRWERMQREALERILLLTVPVQPFIPGCIVGQHRSLAAIVHEAGVPVEEFENHLRKEVKEFLDKADKKGIYHYEIHIDFIDRLYNIFVASKLTDCPAWLKNFGSFDSFVRHFCPEANKDLQSRLISYVEYFSETRLPRTLRYKPDYDEQKAMNHIYNGSGSWVELPEAWVDKRVIDEALRLLGDGNGFPGNAELFVHGTGSASMAGIAKYGAIRSAASIIETKGEIATGEYVSYISSDGRTSETGRETGLGNVFTSKNGLSSNGYTMQRWFNETPVTFGISRAKQRTYNEANGIARIESNRFKGEVLVGPVVPMENVVAISAPKSSEGIIKPWIASYCPHAKFVSYEVAALLEAEDLYGLLPARRKR